MRHLLTVLLLVGTCAFAWPLTNMIPNGGLELDDNQDGIADGWSSQVHTDQGAQGSFAIDTAVKHSGAASQRIDHTSDNSGWVRVSQEPLAARTETLYRLSGWVKAEAPYNVTLYEFRSGGLPYLSAVSLTGGKDPAWRPFTKTFTTSRDASYFKISLVAQGRGSVWFDDVSLVMVTERPRIKAPRVATAPVLDGDLSDPIWQSASTAADFMPLGGGGELAPVQTTAYVACSADALHLAFRCEEPSVASLHRESTTDSDPVWNDDCVEVFLDTENDGVGYLHLGVGAGGGKTQERRAGKQWYTDWYSWGAAGGVEAPPWSSAVKVGADAWFVEITLPFDKLGGAPRAGKTWGVQFCRTRRASGKEENSAWTYVDGDKYARPDRFGTLVFTAPPSTPATLVRREIKADRYEPVIVPQPTSVQWATGVFRPTTRTRLRIADASQRPEAEVLQADLQSRYGLRVPIVEGKARRTVGTIDLAAEIDASVPAGDEAYSVRVTAQGVQVAARTPRARLYGVETIRQMLADDAQGPFLRCGTINDAPAMQWRGWHMTGPLAADLPAYKQMVDTLALLKFNTIVWEVNGRLQYETHPDIAATGSPTKAQLRELVEYARSRHFEVIPQFASFSHFEFVLGRPGYASLAESQQTVKGFRSRYNYCPSNPAVYPLVFDLMGELTDVFQPRYFHIGHDESSFDDIGVCDRCKTKDPWQLWADDVNKLDEWIKQRGMRTILWGDQFLPEHNGDKPFFTARATDLIAKDILVFDWHYSPNHNYDSTIGYFKQHGFEVVGCPWYEPVNVYAFASAAHRNGILGFCGTTWTGVSSTMRSTPHLPAAWVTGGENAWSPDRPPIANFPYHPVPEFNRLWSLSAPTAPQAFRLLDLSPYCNTRTVDSERRDGWLGEGPQQDLRNLPSGRLWIGDIPFVITDSAANDRRNCIMLADQTTTPGGYPEQVDEIAVGLKTSALYFLHTCSIPAGRERQLYATKNPKRLGTYVVTYEDGKELKIPLDYQANINDWNCQRGPAQAIGLWEGKTAGGALVTLGVVQWANPRPEVTIRSIDFVSAMSTARPVLLAITAAGE